MPRRDQVPRCASWKEPRLITNVPQRKLARPCLADQHTIPRSRCRTQCLSSKPSLCSLAWLFVFAHHAYCRVRPTSRAVRCRVCSPNCLAAHSRTKRGSSATPGHFEGRCNASTRTRRRPSSLARYMSMDIQPWGCRSRTCFCADRLCAIRSEYAAELQNSPYAYVCSRSLTGLLLTVRRPCHTHQPKLI